MNAKQRRVRRRASARYLAAIRPAVNAAAEKMIEAFFAYKSPLFEHLTKPDGKPDGNP